METLEKPLAHLPVARLAKKYLWVSLARTLAHTVFVKTVFGFTCAHFMATKLQQQSIYLSGDKKEVLQRLFVAAPQ